jgi:L-glyceraldehyde 3-phosphate reductase
MALNWLLRVPTVTSVLIGASKVSQIEDAVSGVANIDFSSEELTAIETILAS